MRDAVDIFRGRYVLLVSDDKERMQLLFRALQQCESNVTIRRAGGRSPAVGTELVLVDVRHGALSEADQRALQSDPQIRLASVCTLDFRAIVTERGSVRLGLLGDMVFPLIARDRALAEQARRDETFIYELASLGPARTLRALCRSDETLHVSIEVPETPAIRGAITLSGELIVSAFLESDGRREEAWRALAQILELRRGKLTITRVAHAPAMNIMEPLDVALGHAQQAQSDQAERGSARPLALSAPPDALPADTEIEDDAQVLLVRRRLAQRTPEPTAADAPEPQRDGKRATEDDTQLVLSQELTIEPDDVVPSADFRAEVATEGVDRREPDSGQIPDAPFAGPRSDAQIPTPIVRAPRERDAVSGALAILLALGVLGGAAWHVVGEQTIAALASEQPPATDAHGDARPARAAPADPTSSGERGEHHAAVRVGATAARGAALLAPSLEQLAQPPRALVSVASASPLGPSPSAPVKEAASAKAQDDAAAREADRAIDNGEASARELVGLAAKLLRRDPQSAKRLYEAALEREARNPHALAGLGQALLALEQPGEAQKALEAAVRLRSRRAAYRVLLGDALHMAGKVEEARAAWQKALELSPSDEAAQERLDANRE